MRAARLFGAVLVALATCAVHAHVFLERAEPRVGATVRAAPAEVKLWFSEALDAAGTQASVTDAQGHAIEKTEARVDASHKGLLHLSLPPLGPGAYTVHWRATSTDAHSVKGKFVFRIAP